MKRILLFFALLFLGVTAMMAQMRVWSNNRIIFEYDYTQIDSITFALPGDPQKPEPEPEPEPSVANGIYIVGAATPVAGLTSDDAAKALMADGINEVTGERRAGMYEKFVVLEAGKKFQIIKKEGTNQIKYGSLLQQAEIQTDWEALDGYKGRLTENEEITVAKTALYHIIVDFNLDGSLSRSGGAQIIMVEARWGVAGGMNGWGFTEGTSTEITGGTTSISWTWTDQELKAGGHFKFKHSQAWKINMDEAELVKAQSNIGKDCWPGGSDIEVNESGKYEIVLHYNLAGGDIQKSYSYEIKLTEKSTLPTTMYMIGNDFGNWDWNNAGVVSMTPVHSHPGMFWCIRYLTRDSQLKWCAKKDWSDSFSTLGTYEGFIVPQGNAQVEKDSIYMILIDLQGDMIRIYPAEVYGMGDCFGGWDMGKASNRFAAVGRQLVSPEFQADGNLRMYTAVNVKGVDWWQAEFNVFDGKIVCRGEGNDQEIVPAYSGRKVILDFNEGTGKVTLPGDAKGRE